MKNNERHGQTNKKHPKQRNNKKLQKTNGRTRQRGNKMSYDIIINSSIHNFGSHSREELEKVLNSVENPKWHTDKQLDIIIDEDFDMRHITALVKWAEDDWPYIERQRVKEAIEEVKKLPNRKLLEGTDRLHGFDYAINEINKRLDTK